MSRGIRIGFGDTPQTVQLSSGRYGVMSPKIGLSTGGGAMTLPLSYGTYVLSGQSVILSGSSLGFTPDSGITTSGTFSDGQSVTINKVAGGFGTKPNAAKPVFYAKLDSSLAPDPSFSRTTSTPTADASTIIQNTIKPVNASGAGRVDARAENVTSPVFYQQYIDIGITALTGKCYAFMKNYKDHPWNYYQGGNPDYVSDKSFRIWENAGANNTSDVWWGADTGMYVDNIDTGGNVFYGSGGQGGTGIPATQSAWMTREHFWDSGTADVTDGVRNYCQDGILGYSTSAVWKNRTSSDPGLVKQVFLDEYTSTASYPTGVLIGYDYFHDLYVDDSFYRIMVSTESSLSWTGSAVREICLPTSWSDTSVTVTLRQGAFTSLSGKYLWVYTGPFTATRVGQFN